MAIRDDERFTRARNAANDNRGATGLILRAVVIAVVALYMFMSNGAAPSTNTSGTSKAPVTTTTPK